MVTVEAAPVLSWVTSLQNRFYFSNTNTWFSVIYVHINFCCCFRHNGKFGTAVTPLPRFVLFCFVLFCFVFCLFACSRAAPTAYGGSQPRG